MSPDSAERELLDLEAALDEARARGDLALFDRVLAGDFHTTSPAGGTSTKKQMLADIASKTFQVTKSHAHDITVQAYGATAVVRGIASLTAKYRGRNISGDYAYTHVYLKRDGQWQVVAAQTARQVPDWTYFLMMKLTQLLGLTRKTGS